MGWRYIKLKGVTPQLSSSPQMELSIVSFHNRITGKIIYIVGLFEDRPYTMKEVADNCEALKATIHETKQDAIKSRLCKCSAPAG